MASCDRGIILRPIDSIMHAARRERCESARLRPYGLRSRRAAGRCESTATAGAFARSRAYLTPRPRPRSGGSTSSSSSCSATNSAGAPNNWMIISCSSASKTLPSIWREPRPGFLQSRPKPANRRVNGSACRTTCYVGLCDRRPLRRRGRSRQSGVKSSGPSHPRT